VSGSHRARAMTGTAVNMSAAMFHMLASEKGGPSMVEFMDAMKQDAEEQQEVVTVLGKVFDETVARNQDSCQCLTSVHSSLIMFQGRRRCPLKPSAYMARMLKYGHASPCCLLVGLVYLQRINLRCSSALVMTPYNIQRLLLVAVMLASKFLDDFLCSNEQVMYSREREEGERFLLHQRSRFV
jgi:hypothetical protein